MQLVLQLGASLLIPSLWEPVLAASNSYAPTRSKCPSRQEAWIREAKGLNSREQQWIQGRKKAIYSEFSAYVKRLGLKDFDVEEYLCRISDNEFRHTPVMAFATSGGGTASAFTGAGAFSALDSRVAGANAARTGGLLQSMTYLTGQSGGSWPTIGFPSYDFPTPAGILQEWRPWIDRTTNETIEQIFEGIGQKYKAGFNITIADFYGQLFGILYTSNNGSDSFSSLAEHADFKSHNVPMSFLQLADVTNASAKEFGYMIPATDGSAPLYEITPFEFGSWGGGSGPSGFVPTKYLGTTFENGNPDGECVQDFDRISTALGLAAAAVNFWTIEGLSNYTLAPFSKRSAGLQRRTETPIPSLLAEDDEVFAEFQQLFGLSRYDTTYGVIPNPYRGLEKQPAWYKDTKDLLTVDATEVGQAIPLWGLIQPERQTKFIIAWENDGDASYGWNNGTNIYNAYLAAKARDVPFPKVPTVNTILNRGYNLKPVLLGCSAELTTTGKADSPIIAYMTNAPYLAYTNFSFADVNFSEKYMDEIFTNSFNLVTQGNDTLAKDWTTCLGCAVIERSREDVGIARSKQCEDCFKEYCWNGIDDEKPANPVVNPTLALRPNVTYQQWNNSGVY